MKTIMSNCYVTFYESNDYKDGKEKFTGPKNCDDLSNYNYDDGSGFFGQLDDSIDSLKTGSAAWILLFSQHNYQGDILKVGPSKNKPKLDDCKSINTNNGMGDTIVSFKLFDKEPNYFTLNQSTAAGDVWLKLYGGYNYDGDTVTNFIFGSGNIETVNYLNLVNDNILKMYQLPSVSLTTGPSTWVEFFAEKNYAGTTTRFGPNSFIPDVTLYSKTVFGSLKIHNSQPDNWEGATEPIPSMLLTIEKYNTASRLKNVTASMLGLIPGVGGIVNLLINVLWPSGPDKEVVWNDLKQYMKSMMVGLIDQEALQHLDNSLQGLVNNLVDFNTYNPGSEKIETLENLIFSINSDEPYFLGGNNYDNPQTQLTYQVAYTTISLVLRWLQAHYYTDIADIDTDINQSAHIDDLNNKVGLYTNTIQEAVNNAVDWRTNLITIEGQNDGLGSDDNQYILDSMNGFIYGNKSLDTNEATTKLSEIQDNVAKQYRQQLTLFTLPATLYPYLNTNNINKPTVTVVDYIISCGDSDAHTSSFSDNLNDRKISGITIYGGGNNSKQYVYGIQFSYDNDTTALYGNTSSVSVSAEFENGEEIIAIYGRSGSYLDQLFFRTNKGRDLGLGGGGGDPFYISPPMGVNAYLDNISGYANSFVHFITFTYKYNTYK